MPRPWLMISTLPRVLLLLLISSTVVFATDDFPGERSSWNGFTRYDFSFAGREAIVVVPETPAPGRPWLWRARFWGHAPESDVALLQHGFHVVYCDVAELFGAPVAVEIWNRFYEEMTTRHGLNAKVALKGLSRGGLILYNWAKANPTQVACIYGDAPVCDILSWPRAHSSAENWAKCRAVYGIITEEALSAFHGSPIDGLEPLARAGVPLLHVVGDADAVVPVSENTAILAARYRALGGSIEIITKPGIGHHPHGLVDATPIVNFILRHTTGAPRPSL